MIPCAACHRHVRSDESSCPFCAAPLRTTAAPGPGSASALGFIAGLSLLACTTNTGDGDTNAVTTDPGSETATTAGDGDGDTQETEDWGGGDYGGPAPCPELADATPLVVGPNPLDTTNATSDWVSSCGDASGTGPDQLLQFTAPADGFFDFALTNASFEGWLLRFGDYDCYPYSDSQCVPNQGMSIDLVQGQVVYLALDGPEGGTVTIDVTQE